MRFWSPLTFVLVSFASTVHLGAAEFRVILQGTDLPAKHVPIRVNVPVGKTDSSTVALSGNGFYLIGQLAPHSSISSDTGRELTFIMPSLAPNQRVKLVGKTIAANEAETRFDYTTEAGKYRELKLGDRPIMRYMHEAIDRSSPKRIGETYKVFHHVYDPSGSRFVTKGPGGLFPHHRGLFYGFNRISYGDQKQADVWHCRDGERQNHRAVAATATGPTFGRESLTIDWHGKDDRVFAEETREMTAFNTSGGTLIEFASRLESRVGKIQLKGDPQHAGFQFRASQDVPDHTKALTYYVRPDGQGQPGNFRNWSAKEEETEQNKAHINLPWNALCFVLDGQRFTCCYLDHPSNPKPARFSERDYGRFGSYFEYELNSEKSLDVNYRIWLQAGEMTVDQIQQISNGFVNPPDATVETID